MIVRLVVFLSLRTVADKFTLADDFTEFENTL